MRAGRSKKYRKIMNTYQLQFSFHEPYQVLLTSDCLRAMHAYSMPIQKFLENTLHGKVLPYITQCTLAKMMEGYSGRGRDGRPPHLPPPTEVPLRYCKHKDSEGKERGVISETECIFDLVSGQVKGNEVKKNKQHFTIATADWDEAIKDDKLIEKLTKERKKRARAGDPEVDVREHARLVPGVPIIYVKRSVMILEEPSVATERLARGQEKDKYRDGIGGAPRDLKRGRAEDSDDEEEGREAGPKRRGMQKARGPNPLSVRKKKSTNTTDMTKTDAAKKNTRRKRGKRNKTDAATGDETVAVAVTQADTVTDE